MNMLLNKNTAIIFIHTTSIIALFTINACKKDSATTVANNKTPEQEITENYLYSIAKTDVGFTWYKNLAFKRGHHKILLF